MFSQNTGSTFHALRKDIYSGRARSPQSLGHTEPEVQENLQQFLKRMLLNWDALAPVTMFKVNYEKTKYFRTIDRIILPTENCEIAVL